MRRAINHFCHSGRVSADSLRAVGKRRQHVSKFRADPRRWLCSHLDPAGPDCNPEATRCHPRLKARCNARTGRENLWPRRQRLCIGL